MASKVFSLGVMSGAISSPTHLPTPHTRGAGGRRLDKYLYGGAIAAAKEKGEEVGGLVDGACEVLGVEKGDYVLTVDECMASGDWFPLLEYYAPTVRGRGGGYVGWQEKQNRQQHGRGRRRGGKEEGGGGER